MTWAFRRRCPLCKEERFGRSHRHRFVERAISILVVPYRCDECDLRFFGYRGWGQTGARRKAVARHRLGLGLYGLRFTLSTLVILVGAWSLMHTLQERQVATERTVSSGVVEPVENVPTPSKSEKPAPKRAPALRNRIVLTSRVLPARSQPTRPGGDVYLRSRNSVVIVASNQSAAQAFGRRSRRLEDLIHDGALFSISNGTAVAVEQEGDGVARVRILQGAMAGKQGWVPDAEISSK